MHRQTFQEGSCHEDAWKLQIQVSASSNENSCLGTRCRCCEMSQCIGKCRLSFPGRQCLSTRGLAPKMDFGTARTNSSGAIGCFPLEGDGARLTELGEVQWAKCIRVSKTLPSWVSPCQRVMAEPYHPEQSKGQLEKLRQSLGDKGSIMAVGTEELLPQ